MGIRVYINTYFYLYNDTGRTIRLFTLLLRFILGSIFEYITIYSIYRVANRSFFLFQLFSVYPIVSLIMNNIYSKLRSYGRI